MPLPKRVSTTGQAPSKSELPESKPLYARVLDKLNRPGAALAGGLSEALTSPSQRKTGIYERVKQNLAGERKDDFDTLLGERGFEDTTGRAVAGFVGDVVLDPLNLVPMGKLGKIAGAVGSKLNLGAKTSKMLGGLGHKFSNYAGDIDDVTRKTLKLSDSRVSALPDVLATRLGRRADTIKAANPSFTVDQIRTALTSQINPAVYNIAKSQELETLAADVLSRLAVPGRAVRGTTAKLRFGGTQLTPAAKRSLAPLMRGKVLPKDVADHIQRRLLDIQQPTFVESSPVLRKLVKAPTDVFREAATVWRPKFHSANAIGNVENIYKSGTSVPDMLRALPSTWKFGRKFANLGHLPAAQLQQVISGTNTTWGQALSAFERYGLQHGIGDLTGVSASNAGTILDKTIDIASKQAVGPFARLKDAVTRGSAGERAGNTYRFVRDAFPKRIGDSIERNSKILKYVDSLKKGKTPQDAVLDVQDTLFNYRDITPFERNVREVMPFYTFTRKNLPLQASSLLSSPRKWERIGDVTNMVENATTTEDQKLQDSAIPQFIKDMGGFQTTPLEGRSNPVFGIPNFAGQDVNKLDFTDPARLAREWFGGLSPMAKAPIEIGLNKTVFDGRDVYDPDYGMLNSYVKAPEAITGLPKALSDFLTRERSEYKYGKPTGRNVVETPAMLSYLVKQLPLGQTMGKVSLGITDPEALGNRAAGMAELSGLPLYELKPDTIAKQQAWQEREGRRLATKDRNQEKRTVRRRKGLLDALRQLGLDE